MDTGERSTTTVGIRSPRYNPGKQTIGGDEATPQLSALMNLLKVSGNALHQKKKPLFVFA